MAVISLTESRIRDLPLKSGIWRDEQVKGLLVVCHATTKTYAVQGDVRRNGRHIRTVRVKIDRVDRIGLREARNRARAIMSQIQSGVDPTARPKEAGIMLLQALAEHLQEKPFRNATIESYRYNIEHYLGRYKNRAVADLSRSEVRDIYQSLRGSKGQPTATGILAVRRGRGHYYCDARRHPDLVNRLSATRFSRRALVAYGFYNTAAVLSQGEGAQVH